jgi:hypothetical protein
LAAGGGEMSDGEFVLSREQRDEIIKALRAIERQLQDIDSKPEWQALYVINTNLAIIHTNVLNLPRANPN